jgi:acyl-coenzyme A thioesterase 9
MLRLRPAVLRPFGARHHALTLARCSSTEAVSQRLFNIRSSKKAANEAIDVWAVLPKKYAAFVQAQKENRELPQPASLAHLTKSTDDSLLRVVLPFGSDPAFRAQYVNRWGQLRVGKLLEELDAFAANVAYTYIDDGDETTSIPTLVTASMDRLDLLQYPLRSDEDLQFTGAVTYAGSSSMSIDVDLTTIGTADKPAAPVLQASTTFVARNKENKAVKVPRLVPTTERDKRLYELGHKANDARKAARQNSLNRTPPTSSELALVHKLFMERSALEQGDTLGASAGAGVDPSNLPSVWRDMSSTRLTNTIITMPQHRNLHSKVFGGLLMRMAFETASAAGWQMTGRIPKFLSLSDLSFHAPVEVGTLLKFDAVVTHAAGGDSGQKTYAVSVSATMQTPGYDVRRAHEARDRDAASFAAASRASAAGAAPDKRLTNEFHFIFYCDHTAIPRVYPSSYGEAMDYIAAHRRLQQGQQLAEARKQEGVRPRF